VGTIIAGVEVASAPAAFDSTVHWHGVSPTCAWKQSNTVKRPFLPNTSISPHDKPLTPKRALGFVTVPPLLQILQNGIKNGTGASVGETMVGCGVGRLVGVAVG